MASFSRCFFSVLLLALLFASLLDSTSAIIYNYTTFFSPTAGCSLAVGPDGSIYVGLCTQQTIVKLSSSYAAQTSYNTQVKQTLLPYTNNSQNILEFRQMGISSTGTLWFIDLYNQRILGVDSTTGTSVSAINLASVGGALALGVSVNSANIWAATPGASTGTATVSQYDPNGKVITTFSAASDTTNIPAAYFIMGVQPDPTNTLVYVGGCNVTTPDTLVYTPGSTFEYASAGGFTPCDVRAVSIATSKVVLPVLTVDTATRAYLGTDISFFRSFAIRPGTTNGGQFGPGTVWADDTYTGRLFAFNNGTGAQIGNFSGISSSPAFTPTNSIVFLGQSGLSVQQYNPGTTPNVIYSISNVTFGDPYFVAVAPGGSPVYVNSENGGAVAVMSTDNPPAITGYIGTGIIQGANAMTVDNSGNLYVIDGYTNIGYKFSSSGTLLMNFSTPGSSIGAGICVDPNNGNIAVPGDFASGPAGSGAVWIYAANGTLINVIGQAISYPWACAITSSGTIIVDSANEPGAIYFLNPTTGNYTFFQDTALGTDFETLGMAVANDGRIFVAALNLGIYVFSATGQYIDVISSPQEDIYAYSMAYTTASGGLLYVADLFNDRVVTFKVGTSSGGPSSDSSRTVSGLATSAVLTVAALLFTLLISA